MKRYIKYIFITFIIVYASYFVLNYGGSGNIQEEIHYIPYPYVGPIFIYFDQKKGAKREVKHGKRIYRILPNGTLKTRFKPNPGWISTDTTIQLFYVDSNNNIISRIPYTHIWPYDTIISKNYIGATMQVYHGSSLNGKPVTYLKYMVDTLSILFDKYPNSIDAGPGVPLEELSK